MTSTPTRQPFTVRFGRLPRRGVLLGFSGAPDRLLRRRHRHAAASPGQPGRRGSARHPAAVGVARRPGVHSVCRASGRRDAPHRRSLTGVRRATKQTQFRARPTGRGPPAPLRCPATPPDFGCSSRPSSAASRCCTTRTSRPSDRGRRSSATRHTCCCRPTSRRAASTAGAAPSPRSPPPASAVRLQVLEVTLPDAGRGITGWWDTHRVADRRRSWAVARVRGADAHLRPGRIHPPHPHRPLPRPASTPAPHPAGRSRPRRRDWRSCGRR